MLLDAVPAVGIHQRHQAALTHPMGRQLSLEITHLLVWRSAVSCHQLRDSSIPLTTLGQFDRRHNDAFLIQLGTQRQEARWYPPQVRMARLAT